MLKPAATRPPPDEKEQRPDAKFNHIERGGDRTQLSSIPRTNCQTNSERTT